MNNILLDNIKVFNIDRFTKSNSIRLQDKRTFCVDELNYIARELYLSLNYDLMDDGSNNHVLQFIDALISYYEAVYQEDFPDFKVTMESNISINMSFNKKFNIYFILDNPTKLYYKAVCIFNDSNELNDFDFKGFNDDVDKELYVLKEDILSIYEYMK